MWDPTANKIVISQDGIREGLMQKDKSQHNKWLGIENDSFWKFVKSAK